MRDLRVFARGYRVRLCLMVEDIVEGGNSCLADSPLLPEQIVACVEIRPGSLVCVEITLSRTEIVNEY